MNVGNKPSNKTNKFYRLYLLISVISLVSGCISTSSADCISTGFFTESCSAYGNRDLEIPQNELPEQEDEALNGSSEAALRLSQFYDMVKMDSKKGTYWAQIQAENGSADGQYNYGFHLYNDPDPNSRLRARYWLGLAAKNGQPLATSLLQEMDAENK
jgi:TPR repeat protein